MFFHRRDDDAGPVSWGGGNKRRGQNWTLRLKDWKVVNSCSPPPSSLLVASFSRGGQRGPRGAKEERSSSSILLVVLLPPWCGRNAEAGIRHHHAQFLDFLFRTRHQLPTAPVISDFRAARRTDETSFLFLLLRFREKASVPMDTLHDDSLLMLAKITATSEAPWLEATPLC